MNKKSKTDEQSQLIAEDFTPLNNADKFFL